MNAYAILVVNDQLETLRHEAAIQRSFRSARPSVTTRIADATRAALAGISTSTQADAATPVAPTLTDYPYRS